ncbi:MAG: glucose-1-phosphate thymidylyltransferase RfbA [Verrucomicrobiota bacterium]
MKRKGIILAGGSGTRLYPLTRAMSKQLMPIYDKPMIYYPLSVLMMAEIQEILIISTPHDLRFFQKLLGDGSQWGLKLEYAEQPNPEGIAQAFLIGEKFLKGHPVCLILGDNLFYGTHLEELTQKANKRKEGATIFGYQVSNPQRYGVVGFDEHGKATSIEEKPTIPQSNYAVAGLYFYDGDVAHYTKKLIPSARKELEITDLNRLYLEEGKLHVEMMGKGIAWLDTGTPESLLEASEFVAVIQHRQGIKIACLEEIAFERGWIDASQLEELICGLGENDYSQYLKRLLKQEIQQKLELSHSELDA